MMNLIAKLIINGFAVFLTGYLLKGVRIDSFFTAVVVSVVLGIINTVIKPVLVLFTLPINILSLGLFSFVINGLMILLTSRFVPGFSVASFGWAIIFSLVLSVINWFFNMISK